MKTKKNNTASWSENTFTQLNYPLVRRMNWWKNQSVHEDKGGSFNLNLYIAVCEAKLK